MNIYMVIRVFGLVTAVMGPVPMTFEECLSNLDLMRGIPGIPMEVSCQQGGERPVLDSLSDDQLLQVEKAIEDSVRKEDGIHRP